MNDNEEPKLGEPSPSEREAAAYWSRQIGTALALGNAGGIATLAGLAGNMDDIKIAAIMTYPAVSYFFAGVLCSFASLGAQFIYTSLRLEAKAEINEKQIEWHRSRGTRAKIDIISTVIFFAYLILLHASLIMSGYYFLRGSIQVSQQTAALYCAATRNNDECKNPRVLILGTPREPQIETLGKLIFNSTTPEKQDNKSIPSQNIDPTPLDDGNKFSSGTSGIAGQPTQNDRTPTRSAKERTLEKIPAS